jgi:hypothetical protein
MGLRSEWICAGESIINWIRGEEKAEQRTTGWQGGKDQSEEVLAERSLKFGP